MSKIIEPHSRYTAIDIPDPRNPKLLVGTAVTLYYEGPHINCAMCHEDSHLISDCPERPKRRCFVCGDEGHSKINCPKRTPMKCYNCQQFGYIARYCNNNPKARSDRSDREPLHAPVINPVVKEQSEIKKPSDPPADPPADPLKWVEALIDRAVNPTSGPETPELMEKV